MSDSHEKKQREIGDLIAALLDGSISDEQFELLDQRLRDDPEARQLYLDYLHIHQDLPEIAFQVSDSSVLLGEKFLGEKPEPVLADPQQKSIRLTLGQTILAIALMVPIAVLAGMLLPRGNQPAVNDSTGVDPGALAKVTEPARSVRFSKVAHARFFGQLPPKIDSAPVFKQDYQLLEGMVELSFPKGATAILQGPAVFRIQSDERLAVDIGHCSVHAPEGAEGFQVETPEVNVVDRGTRFSVDVSDANATVVQVVEGAADVYQKPETSGQAPLAKDSGLRLHPSQARRFSYLDPTKPEPVPFNLKQYQRSLPDRMISYKATMADDGTACDLVSVTFQRGGRTVVFPVEELIGSEVTWFHAQESHGYLIGDRTLPKDRTQFASDQSLRTGIINIGGNQKPLASDPDMSIDEASGKYGTPGMAVKFARPVVNGPGADIVFFELQMFSNPLEGDAFHVSPLKFQPGLHSHTISTYDLTLESPDVLPLHELYLQRFDQVPYSLQQLQTFSCTPVRQAVKFYAVAVGIDLSDLGYAEGDSVEGLFFQDALNDDDIVDPLFVAGLPEVSNE
ncbi:hypothetical protein GC197_09110 [bacterium]|nr:hypothetical protein [bacterium]